MGYVAQPSTWRLFEARFGVLSSAFEYAHCRILDEFRGITGQAEWEDLGIHGVYDTSEFLWCFRRLVRECILDIQSNGGGEGVMKRLLSLLGFCRSHALAYLDGKDLFEEALYVDIPSELEDKLRDNVDLLWRVYGAMPTFPTTRLALLMPIHVSWEEGISLIEHCHGIKGSLAHDYSLSEALFFSRMKVNPPSVVSRLFHRRNYYEDELIYAKSVLGSMASLLKHHKKFRPSFHFSVDCVSLEDLIVDNTVLFLEEFLEGYRWSFECEEKRKCMTVADSFSL